MTDFSYTTATKIEEELRATTPASTETNPTLATINSWIIELSAKVNRDSARIWGEATYVDVVDYIGEEMILLENSPIVSITTFKYSPIALGTTGYGFTNTLTEDTDFTSYDDSGRLDLLYTNFKPTEGKKRFEVTYVSGFTQVPRDVEMLTTKLVAQRILNSLISSNVNEGNDGGSISVGSISIVEPASYGVASYTKLGQDIEKMQEDLTKGFGIHRYTNY